MGKISVEEIPSFQKLESLDSPLFINLAGFKNLEGSRVRKLDLGMSGSLIKTDIL